MGGTNWSGDAADFVRSARVAVPVDDIFVNNKLGKMDPLMDPKGVKIRESRDSDTHPESNAIIINFDETGSMGGIPITFAKDKLPGLMKMLLAQNTIPHPQILFAATGDCFSDRAPLQVGQFESGQEMDMWLTKIYLEGNGGGGNHESYDLAFYWAAKHTSIDCFDKRGKKGYLFQIGDESYYHELNAAHIKKYIGDDVDKNIPIRDCISMAQEMYEVVRVCVATGGYPTGNIESWREVLGQNAVFLDDPNHVCEFIAAQIAAFEGMDHSSIGTGLKAAGLDHGAADHVTKALIPSSGRSAVVKGGTVTGSLIKTGAKGGTTRL